MYYTFMPDWEYYNYDNFLYTFSIIGSANMIDSTCLFPSDVGKYN